MKSFCHPKVYTFVVRGTDCSYVAFRSTRPSFLHNFLITPAKDKFNSSLWLSRFAIHMEEVLIKS